MLPPEARSGNLSYKSVNELVSRNWDQLSEYGRIKAERLRTICDIGEPSNELEIARIALVLNLEESYTEGLVAKA